MRTRQQFRPRLGLFCSTLGANHRGMSTTATPATANPNALTIDDAGCWIDATVNGHSFSVDLAELQDELWDIERKHAKDPYRCRACGEEFVPEKEDLRQFDEYQALACPFCELRWMPSDDPTAEPEACCAAPQMFLDDVKKLLTEKYGAPRVSRHGAGEFYKFAAQKLADLKKTSETSPASSTGLGPTLEIGQLPEDVPGLL